MEISRSIWLCWCARCRANALSVRAETAAIRSAVSCCILVLFSADEIDAFLPELALLIHRAPPTHTSVRLHVATLELTSADRDGGTPSAGAAGSPPLRAAGRRSIRRWTAHPPTCAARSADAAS